MIREKIDNLYHDSYKINGKMPKFLIIHSNSFIEFRRELGIYPAYYKEMKIITTFDIDENEFILA